jgi:hypothetical protein
MTFLQLPMPFVAASSMSSYPLTSRNEVPIVDSNEHPHRLIVVIICLVYVFVLAFAQGRYIPVLPLLQYGDPDASPADNFPGYRAGRLAGKKTKLRVADILVFTQGFVCTTFVFAVAIEAAGFGLLTDGQCYAAIRVCIALYATAKIVL